MFTGDSQVSVDVDYNGSHLTVLRAAALKSLVDDGVPAKVRLFNGYGVIKSMIAMPVVPSAFILGEGRGIIVGVHSTLYCYPAEPVTVDFMKRNGAQRPTLMMLVRNFETDLFEPLPYYLQFGDNLTMFGIELEKQDFMEVNGFYTRSL